MENVKGNEIDLGLALGNTNKRIESCSNRGVGANANANTRSRFDTQRPLGELVWSTQNALSIKSAGCSSSSFAGVKPCNLKDVGPSQKEVSLSPSLDGEQCVIARPTRYVSHGACLGSTLGQTGAKNQRTANLLPLLVKEPEILQTNAENIADGIDIDFGLPLKMQNLVSPFLEKFEETTENDEVVKGSAATIVEREGKVGGEEDSWREDEGESVESCNSASKKNKRRRFEQQWIVGSKRIKKQDQECGGVVKQQDSSFMNWISNMVKGVKPYQDEGDEKTMNVVRKSLGSQSVFQSLYSHDTKRLETNTQMKSSNSKEIVLFDSKTADDNNQKALGNLWITRLSPKTPSTLLTSNNKDSSTTPTATHSEITCFICGKTGHGSHDCLRINENENVLSRKKVSHFNEIPMQIASTSKNNILNQDKILSVPKEIFNTIRRLRLSRTDILKWMNSHLEITKLDGYFLRLRLAKWKEGVGEAGYYVACITDENPSKGSKKPIRVNIGGVQCLVECRYISNCDFLEDELITWWRTTFTSGRVLKEGDLSSKLEERKKLGF